MSAQLRRQIGAIRKQLANAVKNCEEDLHLNISDFLAASTDDSNLDFMETLHAHRETILAKLNKLENLNETWSKLMAENNDEVKIFHDYIEKYGDYRSELNDAIKILEQIDTYDMLILEALEKRGISHELERDGRIPQQNQDKNVQRADDTHRDGTAYVLQNRNNFLSSRHHSISREDAHLNYFDASLLSRLDLPSFSGNLIEFPEFWSRFHTLVHSKTSLSGATKFSLLKSCLRGRALQCIEGLPITDEEYTTAIDILHMTYDNPSTIRHLIYTQLSSLPPCDSEGKQLQDLYLKMLRLVRQYTSITPGSPEYGLGALLYNKLPRFVKARIYDKTGGQKNLTPNELMTLLSDIVKKESTLRQVEQSTNSNHATYHALKKEGRPAPWKNAERRHAPISSAPRTPTTTCPFCKRNNHNAYQCRIFSTAEERRNCTKQNKLCFKCLRGDHRTTSCSRPPCHMCNYHHHPALCFKAKNQGKDVEASKNTQLIGQTSSFRRRPQEFSLRERSSSNRLQGEKRQDQHHSNSQHVNFSESVSEVDKPSKDDEENTTPPQEETSYSAVTHSTSENHHNKAGNEQRENNDQVLLMCANITLVNPEDQSKQVNTVTFFDSGSSHSYITTNMAERLDLNHITDDQITLHTFGSAHPKTMPSKLHEVSLLLPDKTLYSLKVQSLPMLTKALIAPCALQFTLSDLSSETSIPTEPVQTGILIGADHFWQLVLSSQFYSTTLPNGYYLLNTRLGKVITGKKISTHAINMAVQEHADHPFNKATLDEFVERFWKCESLGTPNEANSKDDITCLDFFNETTRYDEGECRYYTRLPFRSEPPEVPENFQHSLSCLRSNWRTLSKHPEHLQKYDDIIQDQVKRGIISEVPPSQLYTTGTFLSHHAVINETKKTTKIRLVYNGSAKVNGSPSLNDCLFRGPVLLPDLSGILLRIRLAPILLIGDIEKTYHMVGLENCDRPFTKFLWLKDHRKPPSQENLLTFYFKRIPFGLICNPFLLAATIHLHLTKTATPLAHEILTSCYVDNIFLSATSKEKAEQKYFQTKELFKLAGMNVREWTSSDEQVNDTINSHEATPMDKTVKILGIQWRTTTDTLTIRLPSVEEQASHPTKRHVLKLVASIFDPLGIISPVTVRAKIFLQSLWKENMQWDQLLPLHSQQQWKDITDSWTTPLLEIPRRILPRSTRQISYQLHVFTDASQAAHCAVAYLRSTTDVGTDVKLLMGRTRLSPLHSAITIPRLELSALTLGSTLMKHVVKEMNIQFDQQYLWSDSKAALQWVKTTTRLPIFISNRIKSIKSNTADAIFRHVPSSSNPADIGSRGTSIDELLKNDQWWNGPARIVDRSDHCATLKI